MWMVSMVEMTGLRMLMITASGSSSAVRASSSVWFRARPTTSTSEVSPRSASRPSPMRKLSEASNTRIGS